MLRRGLLRWVFYVHGRRLTRIGQSLPAGVIQAAFMYGSVVLGTERSDSDVDVFVVGTAHVHDLSEFTWTWSQRLRREAVSLVCTGQVIDSGLAGGRSFYRNVFAGKKIMLVGAETDLPTVVA